MNIEVLTAGGNADGLHLHASAAPILRNTPPPAVASSLSAGSATEAARADHTHASPPVPALSDTAPPAVASSSSAGASAEAAGADHTHAAPTVRGAILLWGDSGWGTGTSTKYADPFWISSTAGTNPIQVRVPRPGTLRNFSSRRVSAVSARSLPRRRADAPAGDRPSTGIAVSKIPARAFLAPVFERWGRAEDISKRFLERLARNLGGDFGR